MERLRRVIDWAHQHDFWSSVLATPVSLRKSYEQITAQAKRGTGYSAASSSAAAKQAERDDFAARKAASVARLNAQYCTTPATPAHLHAVPAMKEISR